MVTTPQIPLTEVQTLWLKELGISMLWGQALAPCRPVEESSLTDGISQSTTTSPVVIAPAEEPTGIALIKRSSPEGKTKSGRVSREQKQVNVQHHRPMKPQIPTVQAQTWTELESEIRAQYLQWQWVSDDKEVLIGQTGKPQPDLLIIEEMPGADDYVEGMVFSGDTGVLLANMLAPLGIAREDVAITSLLKAHMRDETSPEQYVQCLPYLQAQIQMLKPKCIWLLGARAAQPFLKEGGSMDTLRAQEWFYPLTETDKIPVIVSHHPSLLLINQTLKADIWEDLQKIALKLQM